jgi:hemolysin activation/secretion protein
VSTPLAATGENLQSSISGGLDYKTYALTSNKTNAFTLDSVVIDKTGGGIPTTNINHSVITSPVPVTQRSLQYLPLSLRYDGNLRDPLGTTSFGLGLSVNLWHSGNSATVQNVSSSPKSSGYWVVLNQGVSRDFEIHTNWILSFRADGQWASEPLISNEQFGEGGVSSVRGYHEGEVFGDAGWHLSLEQKTPPHVVGLIADGTPLSVRASVYMDYAEAYLLDAQQRQERISLWGAGFGVVAAAGTHWEARLWFSAPLLRTANISAVQPVFNFSLTAQY